MYNAVGDQGISSAVLNNVGEQLTSPHAPARDASRYIVLAPVGSLMTCPQDFTMAYLGALNVMAHVEHELSTMLSRVVLAILLDRKNLAGNLE